MTSVRCASSAVGVGAVARETACASAIASSSVVGRGDPPQAVSDRGGVDDADPPSVLARQRRPVQVQSPAEPQRRERQQRVERCVVKADDRPDLDEPRLADDGLRRRRVTSQAACERRRWAGWASTQVKALGQEHERVEEAARQRDVVVDHQQPVVGPVGMRRQQRVEVLEASAVARVGAART